MSKSHQPSSPPPSNYCTTSKVSPELLSQANYKNWLLHNFRVRKNIDRKRLVHGRQYLQWPQQRHNARNNILKSKGRPVMAEMPESGDLIKRIHSLQLSGAWAGLRLRLLLFWQTSSQMESPHNKRQAIASDIPERVEVGHYDSFQPLHNGQQPTHQRRSQRAHHHPLPPQRHKTYRRTQIRFVITAETPAWVPHFQPQKKTKNRSTGVLGLQRGTILYLSRLPQWRHADGYGAMHRFHRQQQAADWP